jgi:hypothetical protein
MVGCSYLSHLSGPAPSLSDTEVSSLELGPYLAIASSIVVCSLFGWVFVPVD